MDRMSPLDASFLHIENGVNHMHIASVAVFDGPAPPYLDFLAMIEGKLALVPRYRQKVRFVPFDLGRPLWIDDPNFNLGYHVRHSSLPSPGGDDELRNLVGRVTSVNQQVGARRAMVGWVPPPGIRRCRSQRRLSRS